MVRSVHQNNVVYGRDRQVSVHITSPTCIVDLELICECYSETKCLHSLAQWFVVHTPRCKTLLGEHQKLGVYKDTCVLL